MYERSVSCALGRLPRGDAWTGGGGFDSRVYLRRRDSLELRGTFFQFRMLSGSLGLSDHRSPARWELLGKLHFD